MNRFLSWFESRFVYQDASGGSDRPDEKAIAATDDPLGAIDVPSKSEVASWKVDVNSAPDDHTITVPILKIVDLDAHGEQDDVDPYDRSMLPK